MDRAKRVRREGRREGDAKWWVHVQRAGGDFGILREVGRVAEEDTKGGGLIGFYLPGIEKAVCLLAVCPVERVCVCVEGGNKGGRVS